MLLTFYKSCGKIHQNIVEGQVGLDFHNFRTPGYLFFIHTPSKDATGLLPSRLRTGALRTDTPRTASSAGRLTVILRSLRPHDDIELLGMSF